MADKDFKVKNGIDVAGNANIGGNLNAAKYQASAPSSPVTGQLWVDSDAVAGALNQNDYLLKNDFEVLSVPIGGITQYAGATSPSANWAICDGTPRDRTTYATLFARIGTTYGAGDNLTTFNLPNLKGRVPVGQDTTANTTFTITNKALTSNVATLTTSVAHDLIVGDSITVASVDATFNGTYTVTGTTTTTFSYAKTASNVTSTAASGTVVATNLPFDVLGETGGARRHRLLEGEVGIHSHAGQIVFGIGQPAGNSGVNATTIGNNQPNTGANAGGGVHNNLQPYLVMNYLIRIA